MKNNNTEWIDCNNTEWIDYKEIFSEIAIELQSLPSAGKVASYIPELDHIDGEKLGIHLITTNNIHYSIGDSKERFSIQSISKVFSLAMAIDLEGTDLWDRVGIEPSGTAFNSLVQLEHEKGVPRNPFINAGAIVVCDVLASHFQNPRKEIIEFIRKLTGKKNINYSSEVAESERRTGYRNRAVTCLMKEFGNIKNKVSDVLDLYFDLCSIEMSCEELAQAFAFLSNSGANPLTGEVIVSMSHSKRINAIMQLCGFYDEAGEFAFKVGLPGKSGVGGGIVAVHPGKYSIAVWSPKLNKKGNSYIGMKILESLTTKTNLSIF